MMKKGTSFCAVCLCITLLLAIARPYSCEASKSSKANKSSDKVDTTYSQYLEKARRFEEEFDVSAKTFASSLASVTTPAAIQYCQAICMPKNDISYLAIDAGIPIVTFADIVQIVSCLEFNGDFSLLKRAYDNYSNALAIDDSDDDIKEHCDYLNTIITNWYPSAIIVTDGEDYTDTYRGKVDGNTVEYIGDESELQLKINYDDHRRLLEVTIASDNGVIYRRLNEYDGDKLVYQSVSYFSEDEGKLVQGFIGTFEFDRKGRLIHSQFVDKTERYPFLNREYSISYFDSRNGNPNKCVIISFSDSSSNTIDYQYDADGRIVQCVYDGPPRPTTISYSYDGDEVTLRTHQNNTDSVSIYDFSSGFVKGTTTERVSGGILSIKENLIDNTKGRLSSEEKYVYEYDPEQYIVDNERHYMLNLYRYDEYGRLSTISFRYEDEENDVAYDRLVAEYD